MTAVFDRLASMLVVALALGCEACDRLRDLWDPR